MKFITATIITLFCSAAAVVAAPVAPLGSTYLVTRAAADDVFAQMDEIKSIIAKKREYPPGSEELIELDKRGTDTLSNLITAIWNSGIIGDIWDTFQNDTELSDAVWAAGSEVVSSVFSIFISWITGSSTSGTTTTASSDLTTTYVSTQVIGTASATGSAGTTTTSDGGILGFIGGLFGGGSSTSASSTSGAATATSVNTAATTVATTQAVTSGATAAAGTDNGAYASLAAKYTLRRRAEGDEILSKRDALELITTVVDFLKSSGIITELLNWFASNGEEILTSVFGIDTTASQSVVSAVASATKSAQASGSATTGGANFLSELLGGVATTGVATTGVATGVATGAANTVAPTTTAAPLTNQLVSSVALPTTNDVNVLNSLEALYGGATTLVRRMVI